MSLRRPNACFGQVRSPIRIPWRRESGIDQAEAAERLYQLFPDHDPSLIEENETTWTFSLDWPSGLLLHTDPMLEIMTGRDYDLTLKELAGYHEVRRCGQADFVFSMFHSRALLAPALAAARRGEKMPRTVVHVDAHSDLGEPLVLATEPGILAVAAFGLNCRLDDSETVTRMTDAGFIHKGNFLAAYLLAVPDGILIHAWEDGSPERGFRSPVICETTIGATTLSHGKLDRSPEAVPGAWRYQLDTTLPFQLDVRADAGIWLDVDLDAFGNRFNGDSDRRDDLGVPNEAAHVRSRAESFLDQLGAIPWLDQIVAVSVAASPGFFPSEHWRTIIPLVCDGICGLLQDQ